MPGKFHTHVRVKWQRTNLSCKLSWGRHSTRSPVDVGNVVWFIVSRPVEACSITLFCRKSRALYYILKLSEVELPFLCYTASVLGKVPFHLSSSLTAVRLARPNTKRHGSVYPLSLPFQEIRREFRVTLVIADVGFYSCTS
jgi:hypothetical protein